MQLAKKKEDEQAWLLADKEVAIAVLNELLCRKNTAYFAIDKANGQHSHYRSDVDFVRFSRTSIHICWCHLPESFTTHARAKQPCGKPIQASVSAQVNHASLDPTSWHPLPFLDWGLALPAVYLYNTDLTSIISCLFSMNTQGEMCRLRKA